MRALCLSASAAEGLNGDGFMSRARTSRSMSSHIGVASVAMANPKFPDPRPQSYMKGVAVLSG